MLAIMISLPLLLFPKNKKSTSSNESNSTNSNDSNILDEDETNEVEFHPNFIIAHFSYLNVALFSKDKILRQSYNEPFLCNASQPPFYLLNRLLRL